MSRVWGNAGYYDERELITSKKRWPRPRTAYSACERATHSRFWCKAAEPGDDGICSYARPDVDTRRLAHPVILVNLPCSARSAMTSQPLCAPCATNAFNGLGEGPHVQNSYSCFVGRFHRAPCHCASSRKSYAVCVASGCTWCHRHRRRNATLIRKHYTSQVVLVGPQTR
jgi:hypothetical protein